MASTLFVYCSGSVAKSGLNEGGLYWSNDERGDFERGLDGIQVEFLRPDDPLASLNDPAAVFGRDIVHIRNADAMVIDARERRGVGVGVEMAIASHFGIPIVAVVPANSHYARDTLSLRGGLAQDYIHPHFAVLCDALVSDFREAGASVARLLDLGAAGGGVMDQKLDIAVERYNNSLLSSDLPTQRLLGQRA